MNLSPDAPDAVLLALVDGPASVLDLASLCELSATQTQLAAVSLVARGHASWNRRTGWYSLTKAGRAVAVEMEATP